MTTPSTPTTPAGWYPDPAGTPRSRWWDGTQWTENYHDPLAAAQVGGLALKAPEGVAVYNPFVLAQLGLLVVSFLSIFLAFNPATIDSALYPSSATGINPLEVISNLLGFVTYAAWVVLAYFDHRTLKAAGVPQPFHWAWAFFSLVGYPVYAIGRAVVTRRRTGQGIAVMWVTIGMIVLVTIVALVWAFTLVATIVATIPTS